MKSNLDKDPVAEVDLPESAHDLSRLDLSDIDVTLTYRSMIRELIKMALTSPKFLASYNAIKAGGTACMTYIATDDAKFAAAAAGVAVVTGKSFYLLLGVLGCKLWKAKRKPQLAAK